MPSTRSKSLDHGTRGVSRPTPAPRWPEFEYQPDDSLDNRPTTGSRTVPAKPKTGRGSGRTD